MGKLIPPSNNIIVGSHNTLLMQFQKFFFFQIYSLLESLRITLSKPYDVIIFNIFVRNPPINAFKMLTVILRVKVHHKFAG